MTVGRWSALALTMAVGACGQGPADQAATTANATTVAAAAPARPGQPPLSAQPSADFDRCSAAAGGIDVALQTCAEEEIDRTQDALSARWRDGGAPAARVEAAQAAFLEALPLLAPPDATSGTLERMLAVTRAMTLTRLRANLLTGGPVAQPGRVPPALSDAARTAWARSRERACALSSIQECARAYDALLTIKDAPAMSSPAAPSVAGLPLPACAEVDATGLTGAALGDAFYARYPRTLADPAAVEKVNLDAAGIDNVVSYLVCVAARTNFDPTVVDNALALFDSARHGKAALGRLEAIGRAGGAQAGAARTLLTQVRGNLAQPAG
ncbi:MAG: hypothetical protein PGN16_01545 [Sphingomonas phyllosphaerae]|uniref:hypothetical protein n=1 Tax=Sphingomonas phyllosphaerae TaxID=257003 RepID=UPI002FF5F9B2